MGRGKLPLKLIEKERARRITCMKRKKGLVKKAYELSTLCDVRVCLIIYDSAAGDADSDVKTWPEQPEEVERIIGDYLAYKAKNPSAKRDLNISDFFNDRIKKLKQQNEKLLKQADHHQHRDHDRAFSAWDSRIEEFSEDELFELLMQLDAKINDVNNLKADRAAAAAAAAEAAIQCATPHSSADKAWLDQPSSSNDMVISPPFLCGQFDQTMPFDLTACYHEYNKSLAINGTNNNNNNNVNFPYYANLLEGVRLVPEWYGSGFTVPNGSAAFVNANNDDVVANNNLMMQPYHVSLAEPLPLPMPLRGQFPYFPAAAVSMEPLYVANMRMMIGGGGGGGPSDVVDRDHKFRATSSSSSSQEDEKKLFYHNMDIGFGKAPGV